MKNSSIMPNMWDPNILFVAGSDGFCPDQEIVISVEAFRSPLTKDYEPAGMLTTALYVSGYLDDCFMGAVRVIDEALYSQADTPSTPNSPPQQNSVSPPALSKPSRSKTILRGALLGLATGLQKGASESALQGHSIADEPNCPASDQNPWNGSLGMLTGKFHYDPQGQVLHEYESSSDGTNAPTKWWVVCR